MPVDLITLKDPRSPATDAYRTLRTNILFSSVDEKLAKIGITAAAEDDLKGTAAANLAVTLAQSERKTILVDADLRIPSQHDIWGVSNEQGLTTMLVEDTALNTPPYKQPR